LSYAFEKFISQELSSRVGENTEFIFLQLEGEIDEDIIENIEKHCAFPKSVP
jgi:mannitol-1-phosphate/altronate dehydrogenase